MEAADYLHSVADFRSSSDQGKLEHSQSFTNYVAPFVEHRHDEDELTLITDGAGYFTDEAGRKLEVTQGAAVLVPGGHLHGFVSTVPWSGFSLHYRRRLLPSSLAAQLGFLLEQGAGLTVIRIEESAFRRASGYMQAIRGEWKHKPLHYAETITHFFSLLGIELLRQHHVGSRRAAADETDQIVVSVLRQLELFCHLPQRIEDLARRHHISTGSLRKGFLERVGVSPKQYLTSLRLSRAKAMLEWTDKSVTLIASETGFPSLYYFHKLFTEETGMTPGQWRMDKQARQSYQDQEH